MKVIIAGSRIISNSLIIDEAIEKADFQITEVVSGCARGVDTLGELWAIANGIPVRRFPADWTKYGKSAGFIRNQEMANYADALIAVWDGKSRGTADMINRAKKHGLEIYVYLVK